LDARVCEVFWIAVNVIDRLTESGTPSALNPGMRTLLLALTMLLTACAARSILDEFKVDRSTVRMSNDGARVVARGESPDASVVIAVRGCAAGERRVDYAIFYEGRIISGAVPWRDGDRFSRLCGDEI
jgi:hypothetical protein